MKEQGSSGLLKTVTSHLKIAPMIRHYHFKGGGVLLAASFLVMIIIMSTALAIAILPRLQLWHSDHGLT